MKRKGSFKRKRPTQAKRNITKEDDDVPFQFEDDPEVNGDDEKAEVETPGFKQLCFTKEVKSKKKSGGFQSMGLSYPVLKGILKKGYKVPTPIQRKTIPVIVDGKDVVAMARTGSGKTGAFLIPMLEKLKSRVAKTGARALIFSPTRELALQTMKFTKELGRHTSLKATLVLGGEKMEEQFAAIHENPDIIIATPGRFLHLVMEMDLKLSSIEYVVFDEADRLFEMGFQEQIQEVLHRLPECRQTLMFSATLPRVLVDFVKAGLTDPVLIRLDVDTKLSENLKTIYLCCRSADKPAILLHLLKNVVNTTDELTVVFLATRHHVDYIKDILCKASIPCSYVYSSLDQAARRIHVAKFRSKQVGVLLVTDIAARGIDIPLLDNVINYNFPSKPKLFVHRVGRVARAGRKGTAYSLVAPDEAPYLVDLHLFLGKPVTFSENAESEKDGICGYVPQSVIDDEADLLRSYHETSLDISNMVKVCENAYKQYSKSRPAPSTESVKRVKELFSDKVHPMFCSGNSVEVERSKFLANMKNYRPNSTIFEIGATAKCQASTIMRQKRKYHFMVDQNRSRNIVPNITESEPVSSQEQMISATESDLQGVFTSVVIRDDFSNRKQNKNFKDSENYLKYMSSEHYSEKGLSVHNNFEQDASGAVLDLTADDASGNLKMKNSFRWDRKRKRFVKDDGSEMKKKMKTESGVWIPKSYKSDLYKKWQERNKVAFHQNDEDSGAEISVGKQWKGRKGVGGKVRQNSKKPGRPQKREVKSKEEILKARKKRDRQLAHQKKRHMKKDQKSGRKGGSKDGGKRHGVKVKNKFVKSHRK